MGSSIKKKGYPKAPDGGYGWMIVFSSFMIHFLADGITYTFGIFYVELLEHFNAGKGITAWVPSIMTGITYGIGPIASGLTNKYGCRAITIVGALAASVGLMTSAFAPNVTYLFFSIGLCAGAGFGLIYLPAIVSVTCYFEKRRAFATGIAVCGSGLGSAAFAPLTEWLIGLYGWRGGLLIISGLLLNCCVFGALLRPLEFSDNDDDCEDDIDNEAVKDLKQIPIDAESGLDKPRLNGFVKKLNCQHQDSLGYASDEANAESVASLVKTMSPSRHSICALHPPTLDPNQPKEATESYQQHQHQTILNQPDGSTCNGLTAFSTSNRTNHRVPTSQTITLLPQQTSEAVTTVVQPFRNRKHSCSSSSGILYRKDIFYSASLMHLNLPANQRSNAISYSVSTSAVNDLSSTTLASGDNEANNESHENCHHQNKQNSIKLPIYTSHAMLSIAASTVNTESNSSRSTSSGLIGWLCGEEVRDTLREMMDFRLLWNPVFLLFSISNLLTSLGYYVPHIYIKDRTVGLQLASDSEASNLLAIMGIASTFGRLIFGFISDLRYINRLHLFNYCLSLCGLSTILSSFVQTYTYMALYCATFGITCGAYVSLTSVILVDLLGIEKLTNAFGLVLLFQGVACLVGPPIVGWLFDLTGSYDPGFSWAGSMILIGGLILFLVPYLASGSFDKFKPKAPKVVVNDIDRVE